MGSLEHPTTATMPGLERTIYLGSFVHSKTLQELDICTSGAIGVDENGKIAFIEREVGELKKLQSDKGWENAKVIKIHTVGFFFPGFIGRCF
jgi:guanine deaminase